MKYKEGDKVKIRTWESMLSEFIISTNGSISIHKNSNYNPDMERIIKELDTDRIITILEIIDDVVYPRIPHYKIEEDDNRWAWTDEMIEDIKVKNEPICSRFEILDL